MTGRVTVVAALGTTQTIAWASSYYMPAILAAPIAAALHLTSSVFFGLFSGALLLSAVIGPSVGRLIDHHGGRAVLAASNVRHCRRLDNPRCCPGRHGTRHCLDGARDRHRHGSL